MITKEEISLFFDAQFGEWELAANNYALLSKVRTRHIDLGGFEVLLQFNPERIRSSSAKVDKKAVSARPCFLCKANRPQEQQDLPFNDEYTILINPFPIFRRHLTITCNSHTDQRILNSFDSLLEMARGLPGFVVFYNGPQCGASAPDHLHFQAGDRGFMPLEKDYTDGLFTESVSCTDGIKLFLWKNYHRGIVTMSGSKAGNLSWVFRELYARFSAINPELPEPMLNILAYHDTSGWIVHIIPRKKHRPDQYFRDEGKILVSPASVDLGGVIITPREEDFKGIDRKTIIDIFRQVCFDYDELAGHIKGL